MNAASAPQQIRASTGWQGIRPEIAILLIAVPNPQPRPPANEALPHLPEADAEADAIVESLAGVPGLKIDVLRGNKATFLDVTQALKNGTYQIIHYWGHAQFNSEEPRQSGLALYNRDMSTGAILAFIPQTRPILCFINGCESAKAPTAKERLNVYGLAQAFLETGAYLLGSRWKIGDKAAAAFAKTFYTTFLKDGKPLGQAIKDARRKCFETDPADFGWASYVLYGDPRVCLRKEVE